jgi:hypothetical protein
MTDLGACYRHMAATARRLAAIAQDPETARQFTQQAADLDRLADAEVPDWHRD